MRIALRVDGAMRNWHLRLAETLAAAGHELVVDRVGHASAPMGLDLLLAFERRIYGAISSLFEPALRQLARDDAHVALVVEPLFDGAAGERALLSALLRGRAPRIVVRGLAAGAWSDIAIGLPAIEEPTVLAHSLDDVLAGLVALILQGVRLHEIGASPQQASDAATSRSSSSTARFLVAGLVGKIVGRLKTSRGRPEHWRIGVRRTDPSAGVRAVSTSGFTLIPDDLSRFRADPFPFEHAGRAWLFFEDFPYTTRKGTIGCAEIDGDGRCGAARTVLEQPVHLSYPFVFAHEGAIYMLPEMSTAGRIQLFRGDPFPYRWTADRVLVDDVVASDATLILHEGRYWLFATLASDGGSTWDQLGLFHAPSPFGPWTPHGGNPVLIDAGAARPAGAMWHEGGILMRVAQDCRTAYGVGLVVCRVDRLDPDGFAQTVVERFGPPDGLDADGVHTFNRAGSVEVIDFRFPPVGP